jgi:predicted nucleotidyltransferase
MSASRQIVAELHPVVEAFAHGLPSTLWGVVLFGSAARAEATETSDLDLLVVADDLPEAFSERLRLLRGLAPVSLRGKISLIAKTRDEFEAGFPSYYLDLGLDGIVFYDRDRYMDGKLERIRELIDLAGLTRRRVDDGFFWQWRVPPAGQWRIDWSGVHGQ